MIPGNYLIQYYSGSIGPRSYGLVIYIRRESSEATYLKEKNHLKDITKTEQYIVYIITISVIAKV